MPDPDPESPDPVASAIDAELLAIRAHVADGTLPDDRLDLLLSWIETGSWRATSSVTGNFRKLSPAQRIDCKVFAAQAIHRRGGRYVAGGVAWVSDDGVNLRTELR